MPVEVTQLENGLTVVVDAMPSAETAAIGVWAKAGARHDPSARSGVSHFLEHMAFKGTTTRSARQIAEEIEAVGGFLNAYTGYSQTAYYARILPEDLPLAIDIIADILTRPVFALEEMERERHVIIQ